MRYANSASHLAQWVARDKELDEMYSSCFEKILAFMALATGGARATSAGTNRAADIAAAVRHLAERTIVEDERRKVSATRTLRGLVSGSSPKTVEHSRA